MALNDLLQGAQQSSQGDPAQAMQQIDQLIQVVQSIKDEASYQAAVQQYLKMGGDVSELSEHYDPQEVAQFLDMLVKAKEELAAHGSGQSGINGMTGSDVQWP